MSKNATSSLPGLETRGGARGPYIIAELGVNHDGSVERALELVDAAASAGADAVKLQLFKAEMLMSRASRLAAYQVAAGERDPVEMLRRLELSPEGMRAVIARAKERRVQTIVTVFSVELVELAERLGFDGYKTASPDIIHRPLLEALARTGKPLIVSTGAAEMSEVCRACDWLAFAGDRLAVLQCVSSYPTPQASGELGGIAALRARLGLPIGYSDHTPDEGTGAVAVRLGATILEKHMTYDRAAKGPDHSASLDAGGMARYISAAHSAKAATAIEFASAMKGWECVKRVLPIEQDVRRVSRQSIVSTRTIKAGQRIERGDVTFKRPGTGMPPWMAGEVIGRVAAHDVEMDMPLVPEDLGHG